MPNGNFNDVDGNHLYRMLTVLAPTSVTSQFRIETLGATSMLNATIQQVYTLQLLLVLDLKKIICFASADLSAWVSDDLHISVFMRGSSSPSLL